MTIRKKSAFNLDAQQVSLVIEALKYARRIYTEHNQRAAMGGDPRAEEYNETVRRYGNLIQYFEEKKE